MSKPNLDDSRIFPQLDPDGMLQRIRELPFQCRQAWQAAAGFSLPAGHRAVDKVVVLGMGGSAIGGDLLRSLVSAEAKLPVFIQRDYGLPAFVDERTLVIASSYSGNTEEILSSFEEALKVSCPKLAVTTGGKLKKIAVRENIPVFVVDYKAQPRAALGFSFLPLLAFFTRLGFITDKSADVAETAQVLARQLTKLDEKVPEARNPAKQLARKLSGKLTVVYGAGILAEVAHRWKTQINENSKAWSFYEVFPELNHNATVGYEFPRELADKLRVVLLRCPALHPRIRRRYQVTAELLTRAGIRYEYADSEGESHLCQMMSLVLFGDLVSYYLALLYRVDPSPVKVIAYLKEQLAKE